MYLSLPRYREGKIDHFGQDGAFAPNPPRYPGPSPPYFPTLFPTTRSLRTPLLPSPGPPDEHDYDYDDEADGDDGFDEVGETIMAIAMAVNKTVGCAYYVAVEGAMWILDDVPMVGVEFVEALLRRLQPTTVIIPSRAPDSLVKCVESGVESYEANGPGNGRHSSVYVLRTAKASDFKFESGKERLVRANPAPENPHRHLAAAAFGDFGDVGDDMSDDRGRLARLGANVNPDNQLSIGCAGAVLADIERRRGGMAGNDDRQAGFAFRVRSIQMDTLDKTMFVSADTLASLQIFAPDLHPKVPVRDADSSSAATMKSLSVYGMFQPLASTPQGRAKLQRILHQPSTDIDLIQGRHGAIALLLRPENNDILADLGKILRGINNIRVAAGQLREGVHHPGGQVPMTRGVWPTLLRFTKYAIQLQQRVGQLTGLEGGLAVVGEVLGDISQPSLATVGQLIATTIDFAGSEHGRRRIAISSGVDEDLDRMRRSIRPLKEILETQTASISRDRGLPQSGFIKCAYYPQVGFVAVFANNGNAGRSFDGQGGEDVGKVVSADKEHRYVKTHQMEGLDKTYGGLLADISDREIEIVHDLGVRVLQHEDALLAASDVCGELDCIVALALGAKMYNLRQPKMTTTNVIDIRGGRHPLQEQVVRSFVANDCSLAGGIGSNPEPSEDHTESQKHPSMMVLTGPNHSGKSVYLKQVALIVYLAHIGSFVPADKATIGLTDRLLTRIATRESVSHDESAFLIDLRQAAFSINFANRRNLVLVDEFGKGTNPLDGAALFTALLKHFLGSADERPMVLAATHFHEIFEYDFLTESRNLVFAHMNVRVDPAARDFDDQVTYLYQLVQGLSRSSFGSRCAEMNGVDEAVVRRAETLGRQLARGDSLRHLCTALSEREAAKLHMAERAARKLLELGPLTVDKARDFQAWLQQMQHDSM